MPRGTITPYAINRTTPLDRSTITYTAGDATNGHKTRNRGLMWLELKNTNGASTVRNATIKLSGNKDGQSITPKTYAVAAGKTVSLGPFPTETYGGNLLIDVDHTELQIASFELTI